VSVNTSVIPQTTTALSLQLYHSSSITPALSLQLYHSSSITPALSLQLYHSSSITLALSLQLYHSSSITLALSLQLYHSSSITPVGYFVKFHINFPPTPVSCQSSELRRCVFITYQTRTTLDLRRPGVRRPLLLGPGRVVLWREEASDVCRR
jgi:hypothetical protein